MSETVIVIPAEIDENVILPDTAVVAGAPVVLNLQNVTLINSTGVMKWLRWVAPLVKSNPVLLRNAPWVFLHLASFVSGVIPPECDIDSFLLSYRESKTDEEMRVRVAKTGDAMIVPDVILDGAKEFELDAVPTQIFANLKVKVDLRPECELAELGQINATRLT